jgi:hypothetical protein
VASKALWRGYSKRLRPSERRQWCNKIACGLHVGASCLPACCACAGCCGQMRAAAALPAGMAVAATSAHTGWHAGVGRVSNNQWGFQCMYSCVQAAVLAYSQAFNLFDPVLTADPLHGVTGGCAALARATAVEVQRCCQWAAALFGQGRPPMQPHAAAGTPLCHPHARTHTLPAVPPACPPARCPPRADGHFFWGSFLGGYLVYDTAYSLLFFSLRSGAVMLAHHLVGIAGCVIGAACLCAGGARLQLALLSLLWIPTKFQSQNAIPGTAWDLAGPAAGSYLLPLHGHTLARQRACNTLLTCCRCMVIPEHGSVPATSS